MTPSEPARAARADDVDEGARAGSGLLRVVAPALVAFVIQVPAAVVLAARQPWSLVSLLAVVAALAGPLALLAARRRPGPVVAVAAAAAILSLALPVGGGAGGGFGGPVFGFDWFGGIGGPGRESGVGGPTGFGAPPAALVLATFLAIARGARVWAFSSLAAVWAAVITLLAVSDVAAAPRRVGLLGVAMLIAVGAGEFARNRRERRERARRLRADMIRTAEQSERVRMARELHDVLAHSLSSINVQASMALHLIESQPKRAEEALTAIKTASRDALDEVRGVIGVLRDEGDAPRRPEPGIDGIEALADPLRSAGVEVRIRIELARAPAAAVQLALYRIAQESLTNVLRHADAGAVELHIRETEGGIELVVEDDGNAPDAPATGGGLIGMAERAALLGGTFEAGRAAAGGFRVRAVLPGGSR